MLPLLSLLNYYNITTAVTFKLQQWLQQQSRIKICDCCCYHYRIYCFCYSYGCYHCCYYNCYTTCVTVSAHSTVDVATVDTFSATASKACVGKNQCVLTSPTRLPAPAKKWLLTDGTTNSVQQIYFIPLSLPVTFSPSFPRSPRSSAPLLFLPSLLLSLPPSLPPLSFLLSLFPTISPALLAVSYFAGWTRYDRTSPLVNGTLSSLTHSHVKVVLAGKNRQPMTRYLLFLVSCIFPRLVLWKRHKWDFRSYWTWTLVASSTYSELRSQRNT